MMPCPTCPCYHRCEYGWLGPGAVATAPSLAGDDLRPQQPVSKHLRQSGRGGPGAPPPTPGTRSAGEPGARPEDAGDTKDWKQ
eukprot:7362899-Pyramimonas_sp.AAC.1